jgi:hypothetical protein
VQSLLAEPVTFFYELSTVLLCTSLNLQVLLSMVLETTFFTKKKVRDIA